MYVFFCSFVKFCFNKNVCYYYLNCFICFGALFMAHPVYRILSIELSVLSQFQISLKLRRPVIIARIIRSGYNLIKAWKRLASAKTLQTHFNNRIIYSQKWYFTTSKLLRSTIPKMNHFITHSRKDRKKSPPITIQYSPRPQNPQ